MRRKTSRLPGPLPQREGIDAVRLRLPVDGAWATVREHLAERLPGGAAEVDAMLDRGAFVGADGPVLADTPYTPGGSVWFHRDFPDEVPVPFPIEVRYRDEHIVVADKPHFLATTPRGRHITQTALARLRKDLGLPALSPAHRLDRLTAGLVLFSVRPEERGAYQTLFRDRKVHKEYEGVAPYRAGLALPHVSRSRIEKVPGIVAAFETPGEPNSETRIELTGRAGGLARYRLTPVTGRTHQLRVHMNALGIPLLGDPFFPVVTDPAPEDFRRPLQLLARVLEFTDPVTGAEHRFESGRSLLAWTAYEAWAAGR
ncbi:pseudouridylate synthase [Streptomyces sp. SID10853]|uniref:RluA family pseudouridine synthase n=1 Tax=Streptomyces sp. SID10853 TaxID=2706028 RepID=UPI0013C10AC6|nr:RluA family pseudouridine synthase [Streptomyces sp. SID10853]NDZ79650.1 pseudouridylate synthase [Streptomyces sp. SID10853]